MHKTAGSASNALPSGITPAKAAPSKAPREFRPRRYERGVFHIPVCIQQGSSEAYGETLDFTPGGLCLLFRSALALAPGSALNLTLQFGETCNLTTAAQVAYRLESPLDETQTVGIRFAGLRDWEQTVVLSALKELSESDQSRQSSLVTLHVNENALSQEAAALTIETASPAEDLRQSPRILAGIPVKLALGQQVFDLCTLNVGIGGMQFETPSELTANTSLSIQWHFNGNIRHDIAGRVVSCVSFKKGAESLFAVSVTFTALREWEQKLLLSTLQALREDHTSADHFLVTIRNSEDTLAVEVLEWYARMLHPVEDRPPSVRKSCLHSSKITGWGAHLPPNTITNQDINSILRLNGKPTRFGNVVGELSGIQSRRYASSKTYPSDLAVEASRMAMSNAGVAPKDIEVIISCGVSRDVEEPATACIIQQKLGAHNAYVFDLSNACNGFISGIDVLDSFIGSGRCEVGLVVVGEVISQFVTWDPTSKKDLHMSAMSYTLGDGGGAVVMQRAQPREQQGILARWFLSDSSYWRIAVVPLIDAEKRRFKSNAAEIERAAMRHVPSGVRAVMDMLKWSFDDIDLIVPHQVSIPIIENLFFKELGAPRDKVFWSFPNHGNVGAASMPVAYCQAQAEGRLKPGDKVLLVGGSGGFGAGVIGLIA